jgi:hypothetical protein
MLGTGWRFVRVVGGGITLAHGMPAGLCDTLCGDLVAVIKLEGVLPGAGCNEGSLSVIGDTSFLSSYSEVLLRMLKLVLLLPR